MDTESLKKRFPLSLYARPVLVTEVTRMKGEMRCVAGWDIHGERIVRPLQWNGNNWNIGDDRSVFSPGHVIGCRPKPGVAPGVLPHGREDFRIRDLPEFLAALSEPETHETLIDIASHSIREAFGRGLEEGKYVAEGTDCPSLVGVRASGRDLRFVDPYRKLKLHLEDAGGIVYELSVTDDALLGAYGPESAGGAAAANDWLEKTSRSDDIVLRIGLARAWDGGHENGWKPRRCYLQLNGIITPDGDFTRPAGAK